MRSILPCSDWSATPSSPSQLEWKIGLPWARNKHGCFWYPGLEETGGSWSLVYCPLAGSVEFSRNQATGLDETGLLAVSTPGHGYGQNPQDYGVFVESYHVLVSWSKCYRLGWLVNIVPYSQAREPQVVPSIDQAAREQSLCEGFLGLGVRS